MSPHLIAIVKAGTGRLAIIVCLFLALAGEVGDSSLFGSPRTSQQAADPNRQDRPTFRSDVRLIDVDVRVLDREGRFVKGLTIDDFEVWEDSKPQAIAAFSFTDLPVEPAAATANPPSEPEPDVATNNTREGRLYVLLMDAPSTAGPGGLRQGLTYDAYVKQFASQFIREALAPGDIAAVVHVNGTFRDGQPFTSDQRLLMGAVDRYGLGLSGATPELSVSEKVARNHATYTAIQDISQRLGAISGRRKTILWIGGQIEFDPATVACAFARVPPPECVARYAPGLLSAYRDAMSVATRNNVTIHPIDPSGLTTELGETELRRTSALRMVAEDTGGIAVVGTNNIAPQFQAIVRDTSTYYVLGYVPAATYRDGKFHDVRVRVKRPGLTVRARRGYYAPAPDATAPNGSPLPDGVSTAARDALRAPISMRGLAIDLFNAPFKSDGENASVVVGGQITGDLRLNAGDRVALSYQVFTPEGQVHTGGYKVFTLDLQPKTRAEVEEAGLQFVDRITLPPGRYELRLVADQPDGAIGSLVTTLVVPAFDDALSLSGVLLAAASRAEHPTLREDEDLRAALGGTPTALRTFTRGDVLTAFAEVYVREPASLGDVTVTGRLSTAAGEEVKQELAGLSPREPPGPAPGARAGATIEMSLSDVPPGRYVLTVEAKSARDNTRVERRIPVRVEE